MPGGPTIDKGYSWVVLAAAFLLHFLAAGHFGTFGLLFVELVDYFQASKSAVSWIGAFQIASYGLSGIFVGPVISLVGPRYVIFGGTTLIFIGFIISRFVTYVPLLYLTFGIIPGIGFGCLQMSGGIACQYYFDKKRSLALGVAMTGIGIGAFAWPPLTAFLIQSTGWKGAVLIISAVQLHGCVCGAIIRSQETLPAGSESIATKERKGQTDQNSRSPDGKNNRMNIVTLENHSTETSVKGPALSVSMTEDEAELEAEPGPESRLSECSVAAKCEETKGGERAEQKKKKIPRFYDSALLTDYGYWSFMFGQYFEQVGHFLPFTYLPVRGLAMGEDEQTSAFLVTYLAITSVGVRVAAGLVGDRVGRQRIYVTGGSIGLAGVVTALSFLCPSYGALVAYGMAFGLASGVYAVLQQAALVDLWGVEKIAVCTGHMFTMSGFGSLTLHPLTGLLLDKIGDPAYPFLVLGCMQALGGICVLAAPFLKRKPQTDHTTSNVQREINHVPDKVRLQGSCVSLNI